MADRSSYIHRIPGLRWLCSAWADRSGVAAIEFALMVPLLLSLYFVTMEVALAIDANKKVSRVGSMVADLITQQGTMNKSELEAIIKIGKAILQPYNRSEPTIIVTAIEVTDDENPPKTQVVWSLKLENGTYSEDAAPETPATLPEKLDLPGTFIIRVESKLGYAPVLFWDKQNKKTWGLLAEFQNFNMDEVYYLRPRVSPTIPCSDC